MRGAGEVDTVRDEALLGGMDVVDQEVQDRAGPPLRIVLAVQVETRAVGVEEGEVTEREDVRQPEGLAVEALGAGDVADAEGDLADGSEPASVDEGVMVVAFLLLGRAVWCSGCPASAAAGAPPTPSLPLMLARWYFTASTLVPRRRAISARPHAVAHASRAPATRRVSGGPGGGGRAAAATRAHASQRSRLRREFPYPLAPAADRASG